MTRTSIKPWTPLLVLAITLLILFASLLLGQQVLFWGLPSLQFYPWRSFAFDELAAGRIPFWNPYNGAGAPLLANYQSALFYPPNWLHFFLNDAYVMSLLAVLHIFWAGLGMWFFTGELGTSSLGRGVSALSFAMAGYSIARMGSFPTADAFAWMPWVFWAVLTVVEKRRSVHMGLLAFITALLLLTGHAQTSFYILLSAGIFTLWAVFWFLPGLSNQQRIRALVMAMGGVALGVGITSTQLMFTLELLQQSQRSDGVDYQTLTNLSFSPIRLINLLTPNFFGSPIDGSYLTPGKGVYFEDAVYAGFLPMISVVAAITGWLQRRRVLLDPRQVFRSVPLWVMLSMVGFILATGRYGPVYGWLYEHVPTFDAFREPVRWMIWVVFGLSILAGIGIQNWGRSSRLFFWTRLAGAGGAGMAVMAMLIRQFGQSDQDFVPVLTGAMIAVGCWLAGACVLTLAQPDENSNLPSARWQLAVLIFVAADLAWAANGLNPTVPDEYYREVSLTEPHGRLYWFEEYEEQIKFNKYFDLADYRKARRDWPEVRRSLLPNMNMLDRVVLFNNFDPLRPRYYNRYVELIEQQGTQANTLLRAAGIGQVYGDVHPNGWQAVEGDIPSFRAPELPALAWVVADVVWAGDDDTAESYLLDENWSPDQTVILADEAPLIAEEVAPMTTVSFFEVSEDSSDQKRYRVVTDGVGYLVIAQTWYPGWSVKVDGRSQKLYRANLNFMAVELPPGGGEVTFRYLPTVNLLTLVISFIALSLSLLLLALGLIRQENTQPPRGL
jgi:hypothetical protein